MVKDIIKFITTYIFDRDEPTPIRVILILATIWGVLAFVATVWMFVTSPQPICAQVPRTTAYTIGATTFGGPVRVEIINLNGAEFAVAYSPNGISICQVH
jgi:hypothetical protein